MKKLFLSVAVLAAVAMASCSTSEKKAEDEGAAIKAKIENCTDPDSLKIYVQQAKDYADKLVKDGDDSAAKAYLDEVTPAIQAKDPTAINIFDSMTAVADSAVEKATELADSAKAVKDKAVNAVSDAKDKATEAVGTATDAAKDKAADAVQAGADKIKGALGR